MILDKTYIIRYSLYFFFFLFLTLTASSIHEKDVDDEGEMFWGEDEDDEEYEDEEEFIDDEEYEDDEENEDDEEYEDEEGEYEDEEEELDYEEEDDYDSEDVNLADEAEIMGWSIDISGSSPRFVNESLMTWNSSVNLRASVEAPFLMQVMGMRFRFGAEFGTYAFEDALPPKTAELKGITAMGIASFPLK